MSTIGLQRLGNEPSNAEQSSVARTRSTALNTTTRAATATSGPADTVNHETPQQAAADFVARASGLNADPGAAAALRKRLGAKLDGLRAFSQDLARYGSASASEQGRIQQTWARHVAALVDEVDRNEGPAAPELDVNGLTQFVLEQSYAQGTDDLAFYAQKVKFFNEMKRAIRAELTAARKALANMPRLQTNDGTVTTPGGYQIVNDGDRQWRIIEPNGKEHRIFGDPHVDEDNDGTTDWHFDRDSTFVLPDGTKISCDTEKTGTLGAGDISVSDTVTVLFGDSMVTMDVTIAGNASHSWGAIAWDAEHDDGQVFVLGDDHQWKDGATLGDLYDAGGDLVADVDASAKGTISEAAAAVLAGGIAGGVEPFVGKQFDTMPQFDAEGRPLINVLTGESMYSHEELVNYIKALEEKLSSVGDDSQLANLDLQNILQKQQQTLQMMSNVSKMLHDTALSVIRKVG